MSKPRAGSPPESHADLLLHPVRLRMLQLLATGRPFTAQQLSESLADVPPATLYRHLNKLAEAGVLAVVATRRVRGAQEKTYALAPGSGVLGPAEFARASREDHLRYFTTFLANLLGNYERYWAGDRPDPVADGVGYRSAPLYLSDKELLALAGAMSAAIAPYLANQPGPGRRLRLLSSVMMPAADVPAEER